MRGFAPSPGPITPRSSGDAVDYVTYANLANINEAMRGGLLKVIEVICSRLAVGPTLDYADAKAFLAEHQPLIDMALKRRLQ